MKATVSVFVSETHVQYFEPEEHRYEYMHKDEWTYEDALANARRMIGEWGMEIKNEYFELNEFGDPITCYFIEGWL